MKYILLLCTIFVATLHSLAQEQTFPFGDVTLTDMNANSEKDTSARAIVLKEFGRAEIDNATYDLFLTYHVKIKILKPEGVDQADVVIALDKRNGERGELHSLSASSYNVEGNKIVETKWQWKNLFTESNKDYELKKFTLPNARVGSVIEYEYLISIPHYALNFYPWDFQTDIPKLSSEYWATVPGNYRYNIALRGLLPLKKNESDVIPNCLSNGGGGVASCARYKWSMENIPAFNEEDYMTSKENFISRIHFELIEIEHFDGRKDKVTKEWTDVDGELRQYEKFGVQLRRGKEVAEEYLNVIMLAEPDSLTRAQKIFDFVRGWFKWNENYGLYSEAGIKKSFEEKSGNVGDINLSLVAALRYAGYSCDPMILSTRAHGVPTDLFPVLSDFNYVIAKIDVGGKSYLLDATDDFLPFGVLPERCLNGRGRVMAKKSYWYEIKPAERLRRITSMQLKMDSEGIVSGTISNTFSGYKAADVRREIYAAGGADPYILKKKEGWVDGEIEKIAYTNLDQFAKPLVEKLEIRAESGRPYNGDSFMLNPFIMGKISKNPFRSIERIYPVDYGVPIDETNVISIEIPAGYDLEEIPPNVGLALPNNGGRFVYNVKKDGNIVTVSTSFVILRTVYTSTEYHFLKEMYNKVINAFATDLVLIKKNN